MSAARALLSPPPILSPRSSGTPPETTAREASVLAEWGPGRMSRFRKWDKRLRVTAAEVRASTMPSPRPSRTRSSLWDSLTQVLEVTQVTAQAKIWRSRWTAKTKKVLVFVLEI